MAQLTQYVNNYSIDRNSLGSEESLKAYTSQVSYPMNEPN